MTKLISIVSPTFNEESNVNNLYSRMLKIWELYPNYHFELIFIDNSSTDETVQILKKLATLDKRVKVILNNKNYGHLRSPYWGMLQACGDAVIFIASDLQDPPEIIPKFIDYWEAGYKVVLGVKPKSNINPFSHYFRRLYYQLLNKVSNIDMIPDATGFGIYDKKIMDHIRDIGDPNPYFRGLVCELGYQVKTVDYEQAKRLRGESKNNIYTLYDMAIMEFINYSILPIRIASILGMLLIFTSIVLFPILLITKIYIFEELSILGPVFCTILLLLIGLILTFIGILGEYTSSILTYIKNRPIVIELERINFE